MVNFNRFYDIPGQDCYLGRAHDLGGYERLFLITDKTIYKRNENNDGWSSLSQLEQDIVREGLNRALQSGIRRYAIHHQ